MCNKKKKSSESEVPIQEAVFNIYDLGGNLLTETPVPKSKLDEVKKTLMESGKSVGVVRQLLFS